MRITPLFLATSLIPFTGYAAEFSSSYPNGDEYKQLKGFFIAEIGNSDRYRTTSVTTIYKLNQICYVLESPTTWGYMANQASMILVNADKEVKAAKIETDYSGLKIKIEPIKIVQCDALQENDSSMNCPTSLPAEQLLECFTLMRQKQDKRLLELREQAEKQNKQSELRLQQLQDQLEKLGK